MINILRVTVARASKTWLPLDALLLAGLLLLDYELHDSHRLVNVGITGLILLSLMYLAGALGTGGAIVAVGAAAGLLLDELLIAGRTDSMLSEVAQASAMLFVGGAIGLLAERELATERKLRRRLEENIKMTGGVGAYWQEVSLTRMGTYVTRIESSFIADALADAPPERVVDVGSGRGRLLFQLLDSADIVTALEIYRPDLEAIAASPRTDRLYVAPDRSLPFRSESVEALVAIEVAAASDETSFKQDCARVMRAGGSVVVTMNNATSYKRLLRWLRATFKRDADSHYYQKSFADQKREWEAAGFEFVRGRGFYWAPLTRSSDSVWVSTVSVTERLLGLRHLLRLSPWVVAHFRKK